MAAEPVDLEAVPGEGGVVWSVSPDGFHANLVVLGSHGTIEEHRNDAVDVLMVVLAGAGTVNVDGDPRVLAAGTALLVARGAVRAIAAGDGGLRYLSVHGQRPGLTIGARGASDV